MFKSLFEKSKTDKRSPLPQSSSSPSSCTLKEKESQPRGKREKKTAQPQQHTPTAKTATPPPTAKNIQDNTRRTHNSSSKSNEFQKNSSNNKKRKRFPQHSKKPVPNKKPSKEALELSSQLSALSRQKKLQEAIQLYNDPRNINIRDTHHACILVDCCSKCGGATEVAEQIVHQLEQQQQQSIVTVETYTALLKVYAHAGRMHAAETLFRKMCNGKNNSDNSNSSLPNVRSLNTLLRGCLWTAPSRDDADENKNNNNNNSIAGGVVTSEKAWAMFVERVGEDVLDVSSYEYSITLLCQALRIQDAEKRIEAFCSKNGIRIKGKAAIVTDGAKPQTQQAELETLAVVYLALARAYALLGNTEQTWTCCQRVLSAVKASMTFLTATTTEQMNTSEPEQPSKKKQKYQQYKVSGGKQAWKSTMANTEDGGGGLTRLHSNLAFRKHRLSELETDARALLKRRGGTQSPITVDALVQHLTRRLFYFSGGGTKDITTNTGPAGKNKKSRARDLSASQDMLLHFGIAEHLPNVVSSIAQHKLRPFDTHGRINLDEIFRNDGTSSSRNKTPLDIELGSGFGEWIVEQANTHRQVRRYMAVELRADRVYQIFSKSMLNYNTPLDNLCVVGIECGSFLRDRIPAGTVSTIFSNHPEPPTQTYQGRNESEDSEFLQSLIHGREQEPVHMLNSQTLMHAAQCLEKGGRIVIVTDNRWYGKLLGATLQKVVMIMQDQQPKTSPSRSSGKNKSIQSPRPLESIHTTEAKQMGLYPVERFGDIVLFKGQPSQGIGHAPPVQQDFLPRQSGSTSGYSYFDRLWRAGAGSHAERTTRFVLVVCKK